MPTKVSPPTKKSFILDATKLYMKNFTGLPYYVEGDPQDTGAIASTNSTSDVLLKSYSIPSSIYPASYGPYRLIVKVHWANQNATGAITVYANGILIGTKQYSSGTSVQADTITYDNFPFTPGQTLNVQIYGHTSDPNNPLNIFFVAIVLAFAIQNTPSGITAVWNKVGTVAISKSDYSVINELGDKINYQLGVRFWVIGEGIWDQYGIYPSCDYETSTGGEIFVNKNSSPRDSFTPLFWGYMPITEGSFDIYVVNYTTDAPLYIYAVLASVQPIPFFTIQPWGEIYHIRIAEGQRGIILYDIRGILVNMFPFYNPPYPSPIVAYYTPHNTHLNSIVSGQNRFTLDTNAIYSTGLYRRSVALLPSTELLFNLDDFGEADSGIYYIRIDLMEVG